MTNVALGAVTGILSAKFLGAEGRGVFAAVWTWYWIFYIVSELGLAQGITYFSARTPARARAYLSAALPLLAVSSLVSTALAIVVALVLISDHEVARCTILAFASLIVAAYANSRAAVLLAVNNARWNYGRLVQPGTYLVLVVGTTMARRASPSAFFVCMFVSLLMGAWTMRGLARAYLQPSDRSHMERRALISYSFRAMGSTVPAVANARIDQLVLSLTGDFRVLGTYALAVAVGSLILPIGLGSGYALMPHLAGLADPVARSRAVGLSLIGASGASLAILVPLVPVSNWLVARYFGAGFHGFGLLLLLLAPGLWAFGLSRLAAEALNGLGRPGLAAQADIGCLVLTLAGLAAAVPRYGGVGAAVVSSVTSVVSCLWLLLSLRAVCRGASNVAAEPAPTS